MWLLEVAAKVAIEFNKQLTHKYQIMNLCPAGQFFGIEIHLNGPRVGPRHTACLTNSSLTQSSNPPEEFRIKVGSRPEPLQQVVPCENPDDYYQASFTTKNLAFEPKTLAPIKYLNSVCIMTWLTHRLCRVGLSFTSHHWINNQTNIHGVTIENQRILI